MSYPLNVIGRFYGFFESLKKSVRSGGIQPFYDVAVFGLFKRWRGNLPAAFG